MIVWANLESIMLGKMSQAEKDKYTRSYKYADSTKPETTGRMHSGCQRLVVKMGCY